MKLVSPNQPFRLKRPGQLAGNSENARGIFFLFYILISIYSFKYETIVSRNGMSLGYSERDTCSVRCCQKQKKTRIFQKEIMNSAVFALKHFYIAVTMKI